MTSENTIINMLNDLKEHPKSSSEQYSAFGQKIMKICLLQGLKWRSKLPRLYQQFKLRQSLMIHSCVRKLTTTLRLSQSMTLGSLHMEDEHLHLPQAIFCLLAAGIDTNTNRVPALFNREGMCSLHFMALYVKSFRP